MKQTDGFLLIQLCLCIALVALLCAYTIPSINFLQTVLVRMHTELLCATIRAGQAAAVSRQTEIKILLDSNNNSYITDEIHQELPKEIVFGMPPNAKGPPSNPSILIQKPITFVNSEIVCYPNGMISSGTVYIKTKSNVAAYAISNGVSAISHMRMYHYRNQWHVVE